MKTDKSILRLVILGIGLWTLLVYRDVLDSTSILFTTDDHLGALTNRKSQLPTGLLGAWNDSVLIGTPMDLILNWRHLLLWILPLKTFVNWIYGIDLALASVFFVLFLRKRGLSWYACIPGFLTAFWLGNNMTLTYSGHTGKFGILMFSALFLYLAELAVVKKSLSFGALAAGALGGMYLEQADVALFFTIAVFPYAVYAAWSEHGWGSFLCMLNVILIVVSVAVASRALWLGYRSSIKDIPVVSQKNPVEKWNFATQWSFPPEDAIEMIAPGYTGWRTGHSTLPYRGRMGQSPEWQQSRSGLYNLKLDNAYLGVIPVVLAVLAGLLIGTSGKTLERRDRDTIFWGVVAVSTLVLSFGKYFCAYSLFYSLPVVSNIRNPNKFLQIFQIAVAVLAAIGFDRMLSLFRNPDDCGRRRSRYFAYALLVATVLFVVATLVIFQTREVRIAELRAGPWAESADAIVGHQLYAVTHATAMLALIAGILRYAAAAPGSMNHKRSRWIIMVPIVVIAVDVLLLGRQYITTVPTNFAAENAVLKSLKSDLEYQRLFCPSQYGIYNFWLTYSFPYHGIKSFNITAMPRAPQDYKNFLKLRNKNLAVALQLSAVSRLVGPYSYYTQTAGDPDFGMDLELLSTFDLDPDGVTVHIAPGSKGERGKHCIMRPGKTAPRFALMAGWNVVSDEETLATFELNINKPLDLLLISPGSAEGLPPSAGRGITGQVRVVTYRSGRVELQTDADRPAILRIAEKYDPDWQVTVDGKPAELLRCDYIFQGVYLDSGTHDVVVEYRPDTTTFWIQIGAIVFCFIIGAVRIIPAVIGRGTPG